MSKPTLVLVHGSWHCAQHFGPIVSELESHSYKCVPVSLPSTQSPELPPATLSHDTAAVRDAVLSELDRGNNAVVVAHSYGGVPTNNALKGLDSKSRSSAGASTAVIKIVFLCACPIPAGISFITFMDHKPSPMHDLRNENFSYVGKLGPEHYFYHDLPAEQAKEWSELLRPQSWLACLEDTTYAAYMDIPCSYLYCTQDRAFPYQAQQGMVGAAVNSGAQINHTETVDASHSPFLSMVKRTGEFIRRAAGEDIVVAEEKTV